MAAKSTKRNHSSRDESSDSGSNGARDEEKTIPFLRRLTDMLQENDEVISFYPGSYMNSKNHLGRIVVHDRARVESEVLPRYFNHASFASLRRQLNYFSFTRVGKGRQRGATYCNEGVVELNDILHLKRRAVGSNPCITDANEKSVVALSDWHHLQMKEQRNDFHNSDLQYKAPDGVTSDRAQRLIEETCSSKQLNSVVPFIHLPTFQGRAHNQGVDDSVMSNDTKPPKRSRPANSSMPSIISPLSSSPLPSASDDDLIQMNVMRKRIVLDLTVPSRDPSLSGVHAGCESDFMWGNDRSVNVHPQSSREVGAGREVTIGHKISQKDDDILAGCNALLSFSSSMPHQIGLA